MFKIVTYDYKNINFDAWKIENNFPCLYIIENGKDAYIGETTDIIVRTKDHLKDPEKRKYNFLRIHIIFSSNFNESVTSHYENMLIKLMIADNKFNIVNEKEGYKRHFYKNKTAHELQFDKLWIQLEDHNLVKHKDFNHLLNSSAYKYSNHNTLAPGQEKALTSIINVLNYEETLPNAKRPLNRPILVQGDAGTGKTVVASVLYNYLKKDKNFKDKKIAFVVPNTTTRGEVTDIFKPVKGIKKSDIISPAQVYKENYDIILCDEAHKLRRNKNLFRYSYIFNKTNKTLGLSKCNDELDWLMKQSKILILFYDSKQIVSPSEIPKESFYSRLSTYNSGFRPIELKQQFRISEKYVKYIYDVLNQKAKKKLEFNDYDFKLYLDAFKFKEHMDNIIDNNELSRYCGGYAWEWSKDERKKDVVFGKVREKWNSKTKGWIRDKKCNEEFGSIYSLAGVDTNYSGVVIGKDLYYDVKDKKIKVDKTHFFDNKVSTNVTDDELKYFVINTYAVLLTRALYGTYIYVCDDALREYLKDFIDIC